MNATPHETPEADAPVNFLDDFCGALARAEAFLTARFAVRASVPLPCGAELVFARTPSDRSRWALWLHTHGKPHLMARDASVELRLEVAGALEAMRSALTEATYARARACAVGAARVANILAAWEAEEAEADA